MAYLLGISTCPRCGDQMSSPVRSLKWPNIYGQTCRNAACMYYHRTVVEVAPQPERPRPVSLPMAPDEPRLPATKSAIAEFERAYQTGTTKKLIARRRRELRRANDGQAKRLGRNA